MTYTVPGNSYSAERSFHFVVRFVSFFLATATAATVFTALTFCVTLYNFMCHLSLLAFAEYTQKSFYCTKMIPFYLSWFVCPCFTSTMQIPFIFSDC